MYCRIEHDGTAIVVEEDDPRLLGQVVAEELHCRVRANAVLAPHVTGLFPQNRDALQIGCIDELLDCGEVILRTDPDDLQDLFVVSSELLDVWGVPQTGRSIG